MKRKNLFGLPFERTTGAARAPFFSDSERVAGKAIRRFLTSIVQRRRGVISATAGAAAALAAEWSGAGKATQKLRSVVESTFVPESQEADLTFPTETQKDSIPMRGSSDIPMDTHGDGADAVDKPFGRDAEGSAQQKALAASLWNRAPRIYDDEIIVRLPLVATCTDSGGALIFYPGLATAGPPLTVNIGTLSGARVQLNNIYTPLPADTAQRPRGYAWYSQLYNYYQVLETRWHYQVIAMTDTLSTTSPATTDIPLVVYAQVSDNSHTGVSNERQLFELGASNGADKSLVVHNPLRISFHNGMTGTVKNTVDFSGTWTPAKFDDLQIDITRQPMTAIGSAPNWINYLDLGYCNYNSAAPTNNQYYMYKIHLEFLVHFKKVNMTKYLTSN